MFLEDVIARCAGGRHHAPRGALRADPRARGRLEEAMVLLKKQEVLCLELGNRSGLAYCYWYWACSLAHPSNQPCQNGNSGQENLAFDQSGRSQIKQYRWPFGAEPSARVKPAQQPESFGLIIEIAVAETALNFRHVHDARPVAPSNASDRLDRRRIIAQRDVSQR